MICSVFKDGHGSAWMIGKTLCVLVFPAYSWLLWSGYVADSECSCQVNNMPFTLQRCNLYSLKRCDALVCLLHVHLLHFCIFISSQAKLKFVVILRLYDTSEYLRSLLLRFQLEKTLIDFQFSLEINLFKFFILFHFVK